MGIWQSPCFGLCKFGAALQGPATVSAKSLQPASQVSAKISANGLQSLCKSLCIQFPKLCKVSAIFSVGTPQLWEQRKQFVAESSAPSLQRLCARLGETLHQVCRDFPETLQRLLHQVCRDFAETLAGPAKTSAETFSPTATKGSHETFATPLGARHKSSPTMASSVSLLPWSVAKGIFHPAGDCL